MPAKQKGTRRPSLRRKLLTIDDVKEVVGKTWFDFEVDGDRIAMSTRDHGDVGDERAGKADIEEGRRMLVEIRKRCPMETRKSSFEVVDEWVHVQVFIKPRTKEETAKIKSDAVLKAEVGKLKEYLTKLNEQLRLDGNNPKIRDTAYTYEYDGYHLVVQFGERFLYREHVGSGFAISTEEAALAIIDKIRPDFPALEFVPLSEFKASHNRTLREDMSYNFNPPRAIEKKASVHMDIKAKV